MSTGTELVMLLRERAPLAVAMTASARPNKVLTPRTTVARSKSGVFGRNIMYFIRGVSDRPSKCGIPLQYNISPVQYLRYFTVLLTPEPYLFPTPD